MLVKLLQLLVLLDFFRGRSCFPCIIFAIWTVYSLFSLRQFYCWNVSLTVELCCVALVDDIVLPPIKAKKNITSPTRNSSQHSTKSSDPLAHLPTFKIVYFSENMRIEIDKQVETYDWLLTCVDHRGLRDLLKYNDFVHRQAWSPPYGFTLFQFFFP